MAAEVTSPLSPADAYDLSAAQKAAQADAHLAALVSLLRLRQMPGTADDAAWTAFIDAAAAGIAAGQEEADAVRRAYPGVVIEFGLRRVDPQGPSFEAELALFFSNYISNFPLLNEQESLEGFRDLLGAAPLPSGYVEQAYSVVCPLTGRYIFGVDFTIQAESDSVHAIYGFVMPWARQRFGFGRRMVATMRTIAAAEIDRHFRETPGARPPAYRNPRGPLIIFEKNRLEMMTLAEVLLDSAAIDACNPPLPDADLSASGIGQSIRDLAWHHLGGRVIGYRYMQSSLDGIVRVPNPLRAGIIDELNGRSPDAAASARARAALAKALADKEEGCTTLELCAFVPPDTASVPAEQVRRSNEIFQGISVVKAEGIEEDIYFQAQMDSLDRCQEAGRLSLTPLAPVGSADFEGAEMLTRRLLRSLSWAEVQAHPDRTYGAWLQAKASELRG